MPLVLSESERRKREIEKRRKRREGLHNKLKQYVRLCGADAVLVLGTGSILKGDREVFMYVSKDKDGRPLSVDNLVSTNSASFEAHIF